MKLEHAIKGEIGEAKVVRESLLSLPPSKYKAFHDLTLPLLLRTTQVDHVFVSRFGVFVVETKNWSGRIYGHPLDARWTHVLRARKSHPENPLRQNRRHVQAVEGVLARLRLRAGSVRSVVAFVGDGQLTSDLPPNVTVGNGGWARYIRSFRTQILSDRQVRASCDAISSATLPPSSRTHRNYLRDPHAPLRTPARRVAPLPRSAAMHDLAQPYRSRMTGVVRDHF